MNKFVFLQYLYENHLRDEGLFMSLALAITATFTLMMEFLQSYWEQYQVKQAQVAKLIRIGKYTLAMVTVLLAWLEV